MTTPIAVIWNGEAFEPANRFWSRKCDERFVVGQSYTMDEVHQRSQASHGHYFAVLHELWQSLPEHLTERWPTEEHLRKYALIKTGYHTMTQHVCETKAEAMRLRAILKDEDEYRIVLAEGTIVSVYRAKSQDLRSMDKKQFLASKQDVLDWCADLIGVDRRAAA